MLDNENLSPLLILLMMMATVAIATVFFTFDAYAQGIPSPERNGDITIQYAMYPDPAGEGFLRADMSTFKMYFSKQNLSNYYVANFPERNIGPAFSKKFSSFESSFYFATQPQTNNSITTLYRDVHGFFNIDNVKVFPEFGERYTYGSGWINIGGEYWWNADGIFMERIVPPQIYGLSMKGYP